MDKKKKNYIWVGLGVVVLVLVVFLFSGRNASSFEVIDNFDGEIKIYKSSSCGCCGIYGRYFKGNGNSDAEIVNMEDTDPIKDQQGVPDGLRSCHTTIIGDYFVEGHIPLEAVEKLLTEKPDIAGIAMPGMPSGSPGMPGVKRGDFVIYAVEHDGRFEEFMRI